MLSEFYRDEDGTLNAVVTHGDHLIAEWRNEIEDELSGTDFVRSIVDFRDEP